MEIGEEQMKISRKMENETTTFEAMAVLLGALLRFGVSKKENRGGKIDAPVVCLLFSIFHKCLIYLYFILTYFFLYTNKQLEPSILTAELNFEVINYINK